MQIITKNLCKSFSTEREVLKDINFTLNGGEIVALLGPSGCGKSTVLRILAGLENHQQGSASISGEFSFVFQEPLLLDWRTVLANTALPLEINKVSKEESLSRSSAILALVGLEDNLDDYPDQLSGGMKMRASLARALVTNPEVLLLDEPFAALDEMTRERLNEEVLKMKYEKGISALFVTHSIFEAVFMCDRILVMSACPAEIKEEIVIDLAHPRRPEIKGTSQFAELVGRVQQALRQHQ